MSPPGSGRRIVPLLLGGAMLLVTLAAGANAAGHFDGQAASDACAVYGACPSNSGVSPTVVVGFLAILALIALILAALIFRDRRRSGRRPPPEWTDAGSAAGGPTGPEDAAALAGTAGAVGGAVGYTETPEDVGVAPPEVPSAVPAAGGADIDSLMAELDKISGEILQRGPAKKPPQTPPEEPEDGSP